MIRSEPPSPVSPDLVAHDLETGGQMEGSQLLDLNRTTSHGQRSNASGMHKPSAKIGGVARHTFGLILLLMVVFLWTLSNFLGSTIFADNSFAKPFFVTYLNTAFFILPAAPTLLRHLYERLRAGDLKETLLDSVRELVPFRRKSSSDEGEAFLKPDSTDDDDVEGDGLVRTDSNASRKASSTLGLLETAKLSLSFCILWFCANYFAMACLQHTTVASATIITSTSSVWTLLIGAVTGVEKFTYRKLLGVVAAIAGVILISRLDYATNPDEVTSETATATTQRRDNESTFPEKSGSEIALGDGMAFLSAVIYGIYTIVLKIKVSSPPPPPSPPSTATSTASPAKPPPPPPSSSSTNVNMPLFFSLVGLFNLIFLWPLFPILSWTNIEPFALPPTRRIWAIVLINSLSSLLSDIAWAYAMILTSPLVVTVGLSLTIPLSLVGELVIQGVVKGWGYWLGAAIVVAGFGVVEGEGKKEEVDIEVEVEGEEEAGILTRSSFSSTNENDILFDDDDDDDDDDDRDHHSIPTNFTTPQPPQSQSTSAIITTNSEPNPPLKSTPTNNPQ